MSYDIRPYLLIQARQRLSLARALEVYGAPDYDCLMLVLHLQNKERLLLKTGDAIRLLRWWQAHS